MFSCFCTIPACDEQTDRPTDGQTHNDSTYRASIASRSKNEQLGVTKLYIKMFTTSPIEARLFWGQKVKGCGRNQNKNIAGVGLRTLVSVGFFCIYV